MILENIQRVSFDNSFALKFRDLLNIKHSVVLNSNADVLRITLFSLLFLKKLKEGDSIVIPCLKGSLNYQCVEQLGLKIIPCDVSFDDLFFDIKRLSKIISEYSPKAIVLTSHFGLVANMDKIISMCEKQRVIIIEDCSESLLSKFNDTNLGSFGMISLFNRMNKYTDADVSMICTNDTDVYDVIDVFTKDKENELYVSEYHVQSIDKLNQKAKDRYLNFTYFQDRMMGGIRKPIERLNNFIASFGYYFVHKCKDEMVSLLNEMEIDTFNFKSLVNTNTTRNYPNTKDIISNGFYIKNFDTLSEYRIIEICDELNKILRK